MTLETTNFLLGAGSVALEFITVALLASLFLKKKFPDLEDVARPFSKWGLWIGFVLTLVGTLIAFYYSDVLGYGACWHCWVQRIFFSSQAVLFAVAIWKKDRGIADYSITLSLFGAIDALYQHYLQMGGISNVPCPAVPGAIDCAERFLFEFGHVTMPWIAFVSFAFLIVVMLNVRSPRSS